jgi:hypothetical protein
MPDETINYSDFIRPDESINNLIKQLTQLGVVYDEQIAKVGVDAAKTEASVKKATSATLEGQEAIKKGAIETDKLVKKEEELRQARSNNGIELAKLKEVQREQNNLSKLEIRLNQAKEGSYNKLSAQYSINKIKLNQMSQAQREGTAAGKLLEKQTLAIRVQMNKMQVATGNHTLNVGNYTNSYNGLNTSINQLTRELPVLGMNLNTFFLAISNNIPMLVDEIDRVKIASKQALAQGKTAIPLGKQLVKAIFSWQSAISVGVALLTIFGKRLVDWIAKMFKGTDAIDEQAEALERLNEVREEGIKDAQKELTRLELVYKATQNATKGRKSQIAAIRELKKEWPEYFKNLTDEEILAGKAAKTYALLAQAILKTAMARAAEKRIVENYEKIIDLQKEERDAQEELNDLREKTYTQGAVLGYFAKYNKHVGTINEAREETRKLLEENEKLAKSIDIGDLFDPDGKVKAKVDETLKLLRKWVDTSEELRDDAFQKEVAQTTTKYEREISDLETKLATDENLTAKGREAINGIILNLRELLIKKIIELEEKEQKRIQKKQEEEIAEAVALAKERYDLELERIDQQMDLSMSEIDILKTTEAEKTRLRLEAEKERLEAILKLNETKDRQLSDAQIEAVKNTIEKINQELSAVRDKDIDIYSLLGLSLDNDQKRAIEDSFKLATEHLEDYLDLKVEAADMGVDAADKEVDSVQKRLDAEIEARNNGYAYNISAAQRELALAKKTQEKALKEQEKAQRARARLQSIEQAGDLITASAKIWGALGFPWAIPALQIMWGSFIASKVKAAQVSKQSYGEGGLEFLEGGSHASGNDVDLGTTKSGKARRGEGGETMAIIKKSQTRKYRKILPGIVDALNKGVFEKKYMEAYDLGGISMNMIQNPTDVKTLERDVGAIKRQGERKFFVDGKGRTIETYKNLTRVHNVN